MSLVQICIKNYENQVQVVSIVTISPLFRVLNTLTYEKFLLIFIEFSILKYFVDNLEINSTNVNDIKNNQVTRPGTAKFVVTINQHFNKLFYDKL